LKAYVQFTRASESPDKFHFWTGISTLAGALGRRVWLDEGYFQWIPNFYIILVGPPGVAAKSTSMRMGMSLLDDLKTVAFGPESGTWQKVVSCLPDAMKEVKYLDLNGAPKKLVQSAMTMAISELGTFLSPDDERGLSVWTDLWDGKTGSWGHHTITGGKIDVKNPALNLIACTTPAWLRSNFPEQAIGGGLTSRVVFVHGENKRRFVAYPSDEVSKTYHQERQALFDDLLEISTIAGPMQRTPEASEWGRKWYWDHWHNPRPSHLVGDRYDGYYARKQTHLHKLAMIVSVAQRSDRVVTLDDMKTAEGILFAVEADMNKAFQSIGLHDEAKRGAEIVRLVEDLGGVITTEDLWAQCARGMSQREFREAVDSAVKARNLVTCVFQNKSALKKP
jgi:hypothetical protein